MMMLKMEVILKRMKFLEMGSAALLLACLLKTCCCDGGKSLRDMETEFFSSNFADKTISIVRTRRLYSYDPVRWENPTPSDKWIWENYKWVSMSNMYVIVVIDSDADEWIFKWGSTKPKCSFFYKDISNIETFCVYSAKNDTLKPCDTSVQYIAKKNRGGMMADVVDLEELFSRHPSCPLFFSGTGRKV